MGSFHNAGQTQAARHRDFFTEQCYDYFLLALSALEYHLRLAL